MTPRTARLAVVLTAVLAGACGQESATDLRVDPECLSFLCRSSGRCTYIGEPACVIGSDGDCAQSMQCYQDGKCSARRPGLKDALCYIRDSTDCQSSDACRDYGQCTYVNDRCVPNSDEDCLQSVVCVAYGRCRFENSNCVQ